jgi:DNA polymerase I-like protein with 3'-5' exonuclease and polymerase domains
VLIALDFETSGLDFYRKDFKVLSVALAYAKDGKVLTKYLTETEEIESHLFALAEEDVLVYNLSFELGVWKSQFPHIPVPLMLDCMRLVQLAGLPSDMPKVLRHGAFGLKRSVLRHLPGTQDWSAPIKQWLRDNKGIKSGKEMQNLHLAPHNILAEYNVADARWTLRLFNLLCKQFSEAGFDWTKDHDSYVTMTEKLVDAAIRGIAVDREGMAKYREEVIQEVAEIEAEFFAEFEDAILGVRQVLLDKANSKRKKKFLTELPKFNPGSGDHLEMLCVGQLGIEPKIKTKPTKRFPKGKASFRAADLHQWGKVGKLLAKRRKRLLVKAQADSILEATEYDGRIHPFLKSATVTGRLASGKEG